MGCSTSLDCPSGEFCDTSTGNCIDTSLCTQNVQCSLGEICDMTTFECVAGCYENGDCQLGYVCQCPGTNAGEVDGGTVPCPRGQCNLGPCADNSYCQYGQICVADPSGGQNRCEDDTAGPFCQPCSIEPGSAFSYCPGSPSNFCLVDTTADFSSDFCGVDCSTNPNSCPWGFECSDVLVLTSATCGTGFAGCPNEPSATCNTTADCNGLGTCMNGTCRCSSDVDCPAGACDTTTGQCHGVCEINEGSVQGFCTCIQDSECPTDTCESTGFCGITGRPCNPNDSSSCGQIFCKKVTDPLSGVLTGYCYIGQNCAPEDGVTCDQVNQ
jgi:hypothetical protein